MNDADYLARLHELWRERWPRDVPRTAQYPFGEIPLTEYLREWARRTPDKPAIIFYGTTLTFAELDRLSDRFAAWLRSRGAGKGDRVAVFLPGTADESTRPAAAAAP